MSGLEDILASSLPNDALWIFTDVWHFVIAVIAGGLAAAGFGVLFNFAPRDLFWCFATGALAVFVRTSLIRLGFSLEGASLLAAASVGLAVQIPHRRAGLTRTQLAVAACIPLVPGGAVANAIMGVFSLTSTPPSPTYLSHVIHDVLVAAFTMLSIGIGLGLSLQVFRRRNLDL